MALPCPNMSREVELPVVKFTDTRKDQDPFDYITEYAQKQLLTWYLIGYVLAGPEANYEPWVEAAIFEFWLRFKFAPLELTGSFSSKLMSKITQSVTRYKDHFERRMQKEFIQAKSNHMAYLTWANLLKDTFNQRMMVMTLAPFVKGEIGGPKTVPFQWVHGPYYRDLCTAALCNHLLNGDLTTLGHPGTSTNCDAYVLNFMNGFCNELPDSEAELRTAVHFGLINSPSTSLNTEKMTITEILELFHQVLT
ncbi:hypothetical protein C8J56DRAFT_1067341 [Mycena floridula]|nr:hypothetical protein C8J56DRAFT_1067341 [Mycena floridula]